MGMQLLVGDVIGNAARGAPDATAAILDGRSFSFEELDAAGTSVAQQMITDGFTPGQVALVLAGTSFDMLAHYVGCARAGLVFAPLNPSLDADTIAAVADNVEPAVVLVAPEFASVGSVVAGHRGVEKRWYSSSSSDPSASMPQLHGSDDHIAFFTSGTTGTPKAAVVSHQASVLRSHPGAQLEPRGAALCPWPLFHMAGWTISLQQWHARGSIIFVDGTDAETLVNGIRDHEIERFNAIPALWIRLAEYLRDQPPELSTLPSLRFADTGTSPTSVELLNTITALAPNAHVRVFYGSSEGGNVASLHHEDLLTRPGSCGKPSVLTDLAISADGELLVRGPLVFDRYLGDPAATEAAFDDGWYRSGDRAEFDSDGYLSITGRTTSVIRSGGEAVVPEVVEAALLTHPEVAEVAVIGAASEQWGEIVCAAVVPTSGSTLDLDQLRSHVGSNGPAPLAKHEQPRQLVLLEAIPKTSATNQVDRHTLRRLAADATKDGSS